MNFKKTISYFAIVLFAFSSLTASSQEELKSYYSRSDGSYESKASWSDSDHNGPRTGINPGCKITSGSEVLIEDSLITECNPMIINEMGRVLVRNGGKLEINGDLEIYGKAILDIDPSSTVTINGQLTLSGGAQLIIDGNLNAHGNISVTGSANACGNGQANVSGAISGKGWCNSIHVLPIELIDFSARLSDDTNILLEWSPKLGTPSDKFILERSSNGMTFKEIAVLKEDDQTSNDDLKRYVDEGLRTGTFYYRVTQVNFLNVFKASKLIAVSITKAANSDACELLVNPNPCVPSYTVTLNDCPNSVYKTFVMDGAGRTISELIPISKTKQRIEYHLNKDNFMLPGVYIIRATSESDSLYKKVMIR